MTTTVTNAARPARTVRPARLPAPDWWLALVVAVGGMALRVLMLDVLATAKGDSLVGLLTKWDAKYYTGIAESGYFAANIAADEPVHHYTLAFFPGYPALIAAVHEATGLGYSLCGGLINIPLTVVMAAGVMALAARLGAGRAGRVAAAIVVTAAPMTIVFSMPYSEALFGALLFWSLVALADRRWLLAGGLIFLLGFVRLTSIAMVLVLAIMVLTYGRWSWRAWVALAVSPLPLFGYLYYANSHLVEEGGYFGIQEKHWNSTFDFGVATAKWVWSTLTTANEAGFLLSTAVIIVAPVSLVLAWRKLDPATWLFCAALIANVLLSDGIMHSRPRLLLPAVILVVPWVLLAVDRLPKAWTWSLLGLWLLFGAWFSAYMLAVFPWAI